MNSLTNTGADLPAIVVHGGAGRLADDSTVGATARAARAGMDILCTGGSSVCAVERAICLLEDDPLFDAGTGASLGLDGRPELDAGVMRGADLRVGAVGAVTTVRNPISLARKVLEETTYVLLVADGADRYARLMGIPVYDPRTPERIRQWERLRALLLSGVPEQIEQIPAMYRNAAMTRWAQEGRLASYLEQAGNTVGAVAIDAERHLAAGSSTGGSPLKLPGRVGSAAISGAGFYAEDNVGAAAATGTGEALVQQSVCLSAVTLMRHGAAAQEAVEQTLTALNRHPRGPWRVGLIAVDSSGGIGAGVNVRNGLPSAACTSQQPDILHQPRIIYDATPPLPGALAQP